MKILAIIPARGGSKGIPNKNIIDFLGEQLIGRTIRTSIQAKIIDQVILEVVDEIKQRLNLF